MLQVPYRLTWRGFLVCLLLSQSYIRLYGFCVLSTVKIWQIARHTEGTRKAHVRFFYPADHTQRPAEKNWHAHYFLGVSCDFRFAVRPHWTCTKTVRNPCVLLECCRLKMVGKSDLQRITGHVLVPYFLLASQCMIPKHLHAKCLKCMTSVLEAHFAQTTRKSHT